MNPEIYNMFSKYILPIDGLCNNWHEDLGEGFYSSAYTYKNYDNFCVEITPKENLIFYISNPGEKNNPLSYVVEPQVEVSSFEDEVGKPIKKFTTTCVHIPAYDLRKSYGDKFYPYDKFLAADDETKKNIIGAIIENEYISFVKNKIREELYRLEFNPNFFTDEVDRIAFESTRIGRLDVSVTVRNKDGEVAFAKIINLLGDFV